MVRNEAIIIVRKIVEDRDATKSALNAKLFVTFAWLL